MASQDAERKRGPAAGRSEIIVGDALDPMLAFKKGQVSGTG